MSGIPTWSGRNVDIIFILGRANGQQRKVELNAVKIDIARLGVESEDNFCGRLRAEFDVETTGYSVSIDAKQRKTEVIDAFLEHQAALDTLVQPAESAIGVIIRPNDGTKKAYQLEGYVPGLWSIGIEGKSKNSSSIPGKCEDWKPAESAP
jgi:hypothetical protein